MSRIEIKKPITADTIVVVERILKDYASANTMRLKDVRFLRDKQMSSVVAFSVVDIVRCGANFHIGPNGFAETKWEISDESLANAQEYLAAAGFTAGQTSLVLQTIGYVVFGVDLKDLIDWKFG